MKRDDYKDGMAIKLPNGREAIANGLELCGDGSYVVHAAFPAKETQWRIPVDQVEAVKK